LIVTVGGGETYVGITGVFEILGCELIIGVSITSGGFTGLTVSFVPGAPELFFEKNTLLSLVNLI
jgi:hypothetical protein